MHIGELMIIFFETIRNIIVIWLQKPEKLSNSSPDLSIFNLIFYFDWNKFSLPYRYGWFLICILSRRFSRRNQNLNSRSANEDEIQYLRESSFGKIVLITKNSCFQVDSQDSYYLGFCSCFKHEKYSCGDHYLRLHSPLPWVLGGVCTHATQSLLDAHVWLHSFIGKIIKEEEVWRESTRWCVYSRYSMSAKH